MSGIFQKGHRVVIDDTVSQATGRYPAGEIYSGPTKDGLCDIKLDQGGFILRDVKFLKHETGRN